jgi:uncharacterized protein (DUF1697 family)
MTRYVVLLRGINVGGNKLVPMARLRAMLEGLGHTEVATLLQSGNAVLTCKQRKPEALARQIEAAIVEEFGFEVSVIVRTGDELAAIVKANPLPGAEEAPSRFVVAFLSAPPDPARVRAIDAKAYLPDEFRVVGREIYARFPNGIGSSKLALSLSKTTTFGVVPTARNWATVAKLLALCQR